MPDDISLLNRTEFDLDTAVFFAQMSALAYGSAAAVDAKTKTLGFETSRSIDAGDVQGYWCTGPDAALLAFRGTSNPGQWMRDVRFLPAPDDWGFTHIGFRDGIRAVEADLLAFDAAASTANHVWITGHSLGGALAVLAAARHKRKSGKAPLVHTYGQPAVGLNDFAERFSIEMPGRLWRFINQSDIVPRVPPGPIYRHVGIVKRIVRPGLLESLEAVAVAPAAASLPPAAAPQLIGAPALEVARAAADAKLTTPQLTDYAPAQMTNEEFARFQLGLNASGGAGLEGATLEGLLPSWIGDHAISEYTRLLQSIRDQGSR